MISIFQIYIGFNSCAFANITLPALAADFLCWWHAQRQIPFVIYPGQHCACLLFGYQWATHFLKIHEALIMQGYLPQECNRLITHNLYKSLFLPFLFMLDKLYLCHRCTRLKYFLKTLIRVLSLSNH